MPRTGGTVQQDPVQRQETQIVQSSCKTLDDFLPGFRPLATRWANTHKTAAEAVTVITHLVSFERSLLRVARIGEDGGDAP